MSRFLILALKVGLSVGLVWYAFSKIDVASALVYLKAIPFYAVVLAVALLFLQYAVAALRLQRLLAIFKAPCGILKSLNAVMIGAFFSQTFISFVGGDAMRIWHIVKDNIPVGTAAKAVLFDRIFGFVGLILLIVLGLPLLWKLLPDPHMRGSLVLLLVLAGIGGGSFMVMDKLPGGLRRWRAFGIAADLAVSVRQVVGSTSRLLDLLWLSLVIQVLNIVVLFVLAKGLSVELGFFDMLVLIPPVIFLSMMPISFAGWGVREGAMIVALNLVRVPPHQSLALSICYGLCLVVISLPGGALWFIDRRQSSGRKPTDVNLAAKGN